MYHGVINIYKEPGFTSHDVVAKLRGILRQKKIGHTGTLDPAAEGVLPVCLGQGTRLVELLSGQVKTYQAVLLLGRETDTQDTTGQTVAEHPVTVTEEEVAWAAASFAGNYNQIPPMYSALKVGGKKLYELAREGKVVERQPREVQIFNLSVDWISLPKAGITVTCSKGTYIRTLCHDIGQKLNCGGCMEHLKRIQVGRFALEESVTLSQVQQLKEEGRLDFIILPIEEMFDGPKAVALPEWDGLVENGNPVDGSVFSSFIWENGEEQGEDPAKYITNLTRKDGWEDETKDREQGHEKPLVRVYSSSREFLGVYQYETDRDRWKPKKMFLREK
ncbi:MAG: tRNA pseudouridine(55) synthase TruB [Lachnospiraceae bacterium]|jgi:tRNA pseudouridine55 synthase|nr:tRNA pseudouridine(55) synthase TruB [Lachnospiraceae bacterium]